MTIQTVNYTQTFLKTKYQKYISVKTRDISTIFNME